MYGVRVEACHSCEGLRCCAWAHLTAGGKHGAASEYMRGDETRARRNRHGVHEPVHKFVRKCCWLMFSIMRLQYRFKLLLRPYVVLSGATRSNNDVTR